MNKMVYAGIGIVVIVAIALVYLTSQNGAVSSTTTSGTTSVNNGSTTVGSATTTNATTTATANTTTVLAPGTVVCTPINSTFTCSNATYTYSSNGTTSLFVTISQKTGQDWSSFGVGYAPTGTTYTSGLPQITWYTANYTSSGNVGTTLQTNTTILIKPDNNESGAAFGQIANGTIWVCFVNSGYLYVGNSCQPNAGGPGAATYLKIANISTTT